MACNTREPSVSLGRLRARVLEVHFVVESQEAKPRCARTCSMQTVDARASRAPATSATRYELIDYANYFKILVARETQRSKTRKRARNGYVSRLDAFLARSGGGRTQGDDVLEAVERALDSFEGYPRSDTQKDFHLSMINASLPHIYGDNWENVRERVLHQRGLATVLYEMLICSPRRFGKTTSVSMYCAVMLVHCPETWISVFSTGQRASTLLLDQCAKFTKMLIVNALDRVAKHNQVRKSSADQIYRQTD